MDRRDRQQHYSCLVALETARRIMADPTLIERGRQHLERFIRHDPTLREGHRLWASLIRTGFWASCWPGPGAVVARGSCGTRCG